MTVTLSQGSSHSDISVTLGLPSLVVVDGRAFFVGERDCGSHSLQVVFGFQLLQDMTLVTQANAT